MKFNSNFTYMLWNPLAAQIQYETTHDLSYSFFIHCTVLYFFMVVLHSEMEHYSLMYLM
jgi:hypothetical protein